MSFMNDHDSSMAQVIVALRVNQGWLPDRCSPGAINDYNAGRIALLWLLFLSAVWRTFL